MKLLIVGGVAGGASTATRARRIAEDAEIIVFERGPDVSFAKAHFRGRTPQRRERPQQPGVAAAGHQPPSFTVSAALIARNSLGYNLLSVNGSR